MRRGPAPRGPDILLSGDQKRLLWHLRTHGPTPRTGIADALGMHNATVTRLVRDLMVLGCIDEQDGRASGRGRPVVPLEISGRAGYAAGAMAHPGWLELVLVDFAGRTLVRHQEPFASPDPAAFIALVGARLRTLAADMPLMRTRFLGLGVAIPGAVTREGPTRRWTVRWLEGWREVEHPAFFEDALGMPVWVENEAKLAGLADFYDRGLERRHRSALSLFVGHGVGGSVIAERDVLTGEFGNAGDLGRLFPDLERPRPSGIDLLRELNAAGAGLESLLDIARVLDPQAAVIAAWVERAAAQLVTLAASGAAWLDPGAIIMSGSLPVPVLAALGERIAAADAMFGLTPLPRPDFHVTRLGSWATPIGAAMLPIQAILDDQPS